MPKIVLYKLDKLMYSIFTDEKPRGETEMATKIYNTETNEVVELTLMSDGQDFLADVIGGCDQAGGWASEDMPESAEFAMTSEELAWWEDWAEREQVILDRANEIGEEAIEKLSELAMDYGHDMETLQVEEEKFLGIV